jgi:NAD(P)-dependent dehydrogenase (short-subunit alcohol dehydrogenase family)
MKLKPINQQVVVVMGASSGMGRATALKFAERGAKLVVSARNEQALASLVNEIRETGAPVLSVVADVSDVHEVKAVADAAVAEYGRLDTWVHFPGVIVYALFADTTHEEFQRVIEVNLLGQAYGAMAALPHLIQAGRGALIHVSSIESVVSFPYHSAYAASKHGITGFLDALRIELKHQGLPISVTNIMPSVINTPLYNKARTKLGVAPRIPPPAYHPDTVADQILYAAEHPVRDLIGGGVGKVMVLAQKLSPRLVDTGLLWAGFWTQQSNEPKSLDAPDNLFHSLHGYDYVEGKFSDIALRHSAYNWLARHPYLRWTITGMALGLIGLRSMWVRNHEK